MSQSNIDPILQKLQEMQAEFHDVYYVEFGKEEFLYREISRNEFSRLSQAFKETEKLEEAICSLAVFMPEDFNWTTCAAGIPTALATHILDASGFTEGNEESIIMKAEERFINFRAEMNSLENQLSAIIAVAFPQYKVEEIENWSLTKTMWMLSRAEFALELKGMAIDIKGFGEAKKPQKEKQASHMPTLSGDQDSSTFPELADIRAFLNEGK